MFVDKVEVVVRAGNGGNGRVSFRHEKFVERGGPDGGDGGDGGSIILQASNNEDTLATFRFKKLVKAKDGQSGDKSRKHGQTADDEIVMVPLGTVVTTEEGKEIADLDEVGKRVVIAKGGKGGFGNAHFKSSVRRAPRVAEKGEDGEDLRLTFELKMIADVGFVGLPNAGKSTLLASASNARPEIANYPFTTLKPNLGMVPIGKDTALLCADIPGLIEGAAEGKGLGDEFLRHVERTNVLVHVIDIYSEDLTKDYKTIMDELKRYSPELAKKPIVAALNKVDGFDKDMVADKLKELKKVAGRGVKTFAMSAKSNQGVKELISEVYKVVEKAKKKTEKEKNDEIPVIKYVESEDEWTVKKLDKGFEVTGGKIEKFAGRTDFENPHGVDRLMDIMRKMGIMNELDRLKIEPNDVIYFGVDHKNKLSY
ncbi:MAG: GTPase ObgE [bacterium]|nr:GTPase ObgE [bacterium]